MSSENVTIDSQLLVGAEARYQLLANEHETLKEQMRQRESMWNEMLARQEKAMTETLERLQTKNAETMYQALKQAQTDALNATKTGGTVPHRPATDQTTVETKSGSSGARPNKPVAYTGVRTANAVNSFIYSINQYVAKLPNDDKISTFISFLDGEALA
jgi:hypothetical protein